MTNFKVLHLFKFRAFSLSLSLLAALFFSFFLTGCGGGGSSSGGGSSVTTNATSPVITVQPTNASYVQGDTATNLSVIASITDTGTLSYQWYSNNIDSTSGGTLLTGATSQTYTPSTSEANTTYYYVVVTNTNNNVNGDKVASTKSNVIKITVTAAIKHLINFYDKNLDFIESVLVNEGNINPSSIKSGGWYKKGENVPLIYYNLDNDINLYAIANVQEITTQEELDAIRTNLSGKYVLINDIELNATDGAPGVDSEGWQPVGNSISVYFSGVFNGNNHTISNVYINKTTSYVGLFGHIRFAQVDNLRVEGEIKGAGYVGGIAGRNHIASISNGYFNGSIVGTGSHTGGIAGYNSDGSNITNSYSEGTISGTSYVGGIVGNNYMYGTTSNIVSYSHSSANISGTGSYVGGIAGYNTGSIIKNSYFTGNVASAGARVGGIVGHSESGTVENSYFAGTISSTNQYVGGIVGYQMHNTVKNNYSTGTINGTNSVGGIVGNANVNTAGSIINNYSRAIVNGSGNNVGGIIGLNAAVAIVSSNVALNPSIAGSTNVNRIIGSLSSGAISNNFALEDIRVNDYTVVGDDGSGTNGVSKTITELKTQSTYSNATTDGGFGWKFGNNDDNPWKIDANKNNGYPYLYWQEL
jgi:hypothetical protein